MCVSVGVLCAPLLGAIDLTWRPPHRLSHPSPSPPDSHTLCDGTGLFFRDAMTASTLVQVIQRVILGAGPRQHRDMLLRAEQRFLDLEGRPLWLRVVKDPRIGAFHSFSGAWVGGWVR